MYHCIHCVVVTKGVVELHGGKISVYSDGEGHGSTFTVALPVYFADADLPEPQPRLQSQRSFHRPVSSLLEAGQLLHRVSSSVVSNSFLRRDRIAPDTHGSSAEIASMSSGGLVQSFQPSDESDGSADLVSGLLRINRNTLNASPAIRGDQPKPRRVLVVDDANLNRKMVCRSIKHSCEDIMEAGDGVQAVAVVRQSLSLGHPIDVVFMDYEMPEMDGPTAAAAMRRIGYTGAIIGITGNTLKHSRDHFLSHGADRVLSKPVEMQVLRQILSGMHTAIDTCLSTFVANNLLCPCLLLGRPTS